MSIMLPRLPAGDGDAVPAPRPPRPHDGRAPRRAGPPDAGAAARSAGTQRPLPRTPATLRAHHARAAQAPGQGRQQYPCVFRANYFDLMFATLFVSNRHFNLQTHHRILRFFVRSKCHHNITMPIILSQNRLLLTRRKRFTMDPYCIHPSAFAYRRNPSFL